MAKFSQRIEMVSNGVVITNRLTGNREMNPNASKITEYAKNHIATEIESGIPGEYFDIEITVKKYANQKPKV